MKLLKFGVISLFVISLLSSCLGDSDSEFSTTSFAYVKTTESGSSVYATTPFMDITSTEIKNMDVGSCALLYFKVKNYGSGINTTDAIDIEEENLYKSEFRTVNPTISSADEVFPTELSFDTRYGAYNNGYYAFQSVFGDYWLFSTKFNFDTDTPVAAYFIYDKDNQIVYNADGSINDTHTPKPGTNQIIIDVRFEKNPSRDNFTAPKNQGAKYFVARMNPLRQILNPIDNTTETGSSYILAPIKFRFTKYTKDPGSNEWKSQQSVIGSWDTYSTSFRCMAFEKPE